MISITRLLRPRHWVKNTLVLAAYIFALGDSEQAVHLTQLSALKALAGAALFCMISSAVYVMNDIVDVELDRQHPAKRHRPIAAGEVPIPTARAISAALFGISFLAAYLLAPSLAIVLASYVVLQLAYTFALKRVALLDVFVIGTGFVMRALAGAVVIDVMISPWLVLCTFLLALFLGFCKRKQEKGLVHTDGGENRPSLAHYDAHLLDQVIAIVSSATIVSYALYTLSPDTVTKFGSSELGLTIPFVMFGILRYLDLVYRHEQGDRPEKILLTDPPLLLNILLYGIAILVIFARH